MFIIIFTIFTDSLPLVWCTCLCTFCLAIHTTIFVPFLKCNLDIHLVSWIGPRFQLFLSQIDFCRTGEALSHPSSQHDGWWRVLFVSWCWANSGRFVQGFPQDKHGMARDKTMKHIDDLWSYRRGRQQKANLIKMVTSMSEGNQNESHLLLL